MSALEPGLFLVASAGIVAFSWPSLVNPRTHGFPRFLAFEALLTLILLNAPHWFSDPWAARQLASWLLLVGSLFLAIHGFRLLAAAGRPRGSFENTTALVESGAYRWIRHPLYASLLCLAWGVFLKGISAASIVLAVAATVFLIATAKVEEAENVAKFGDGYRAYMSRTRMFIPFVF